MAVDSFAPRTKQIGSNTAYEGVIVTDASGVLSVKKSQIGGSAVPASEGSESDYSVGSLWLNDVHYISHCLVDTASNGKWTTMIGSWTGSANATLSTSTTSTTPVLINSMEITIPDTGRYLFHYNGTGYGVDTNQSVNLGIYDDDVLIPGSDRIYKVTGTLGEEAIKAVWSTMVEASVVAGSVVDVQWYCDYGTIHAMQRKFYAIRVG